MSGASRTELGFSPNAYRNAADERGESFHRRRLGRKAVKGLVNSKLIIKLSKEKQIMSGSQIARACIHEEYPPGSLGLHVSQAPMARHHGPRRPRSPYFRVLARRESTGGVTQLRKNLAWARWRDRLGTQARPITQAGGSFVQLLRASQWHFSARRLYLDLGCEEARAMASILVGASDNEAPAGR